MDVSEWDGGALRLAMLLLGLGFLTQARGVGLALTAGGVVALALGPERLRRAWLPVGLLDGGLRVHGRARVVGRVVETTAAGETRLTFGGGQRADLWRIALIELGENPVTGVGEGSYRFRYYAERRTDRNVSVTIALRSTSTAAGR